MRYALIEIELGKEHGFNPVIHRTIKGYMVVNENELRNINPDPAEAARMLGVELLSLSELNNKIRELL